MPALLACGPAPASDAGSSGDLPTPGTTTGADDVASTDPPVDPRIPIPDMGMDEPPSSFITMTDGGGGVSFECDLFAQDCDPGQKCNVWANDGGPAWNATRCVPVDPDPDQAGEPCTVQDSPVSGLDSCDVGAICWGVDADGVGECVDFCQGSAEAPICENPDLRCGGGRSIPLCVPSCCPIEQDCDADEACYPANDDFHCAVDASGEDNGAFGDPCEFINSCDAGLACIGADALTDCVGAIGCCSPYCTVGTTMCADLDPEMDCEPWFAEGQAPPGFETLGVCALSI